MANIFGLDAKDLDRTVYTVLADWITQYAALENESIRALGDNTREGNPWQIQALLWVNSRAEENPALKPDDYSGVWEPFRAALAAKGMEVPEQLTEEFLLNPELPRRLQPSRDRFRVRTRFESM